MKARLKNGNIVHLASEIRTKSGYGSVRWVDICELIQEPHEVATGCVIGINN